MGVPLYILESELLGHPINKKTNRTFTKSFIGKFGNFGKVTLHTIAISCRHCKVNSCKN